MPLRRYLFWGLTLVLVVALVNLVIRGYRLDKQKSQQMVETIEEAKPSATRVLNPPDLKIMQSEMVLQPESGKEKGFRVALHKIEISNTGTVSYKDLQVRFVYLGLKKQPLGTKTYLIDKPLAAGTTLKLADISIDHVPEAAAALETAILSADIQRPNPAKQ